MLSYLYVTLPKIIEAGASFFLNSLFLLVCNYALQRVVQHFAIDKVYLYNRLGAFSTATVLSLSISGSGYQSCSGICAEDHFHKCKTFFCHCLHCSWCINISLCQKILFGLYPTLPFLLHFLSLSSHYSISQQTKLLSLLLCSLQQLLLLVIVGPKSLLSQPIHTLCFAHFIFFHKSVPLAPWSLVLLFFKLLVKSVNILVMIRGLITEHSVMHVISPQWERRHFTVSLFHGTALLQHSLNIAFFSLFTDTVCPKASGFAQGYAQRVKLWEAPGHTRLVVCKSLGQWQSLLAKLNAHILDSAVWTGLFQLGLF